jgi:hypothetical protein
VTLCFNRQPDWSNSIYIAALASLPEPSGSVQQLVSLAPRQPFRVGQAGARLGGEGYESFRLYIRYVERWFLGFWWEANSLQI